MRLPPHRRSRGSTSPVCPSWVQCRSPGTGPVPCGFEPTQPLPPAFPQHRWGSTDVELLFHTDVKHCCAQGPGAACLGPPLSLPPESRGEAPLP